MSVRVFTACGCDHQADGAPQQPELNLKGVSRLFPPNPRYQEPRCRSSRSSGHHWPGTERDPTPGELTLNLQPKHVARSSKRFLRRTNEEMGISPACTNLEEGTPLKSTNWQGFSCPPNTVPSAWRAQPNRRALSSAFGLRRTGLGLSGVEDGRALRAAAAQWRHGTSLGEGPGGPGPGTWVPVLWTAGNCLRMWYPAPGEVKQEIE